MSADLQHDIVVWLHQQPDWLQSSVEKLLSTGALTDADIQVVVNHLKTIEGQRVTTHRAFEDIVRPPSSATELRLLSIGDISGIEALGPRVPLTFGTGNLTVIYGHNGSGKSGYTRILKRASGKPRAADLKPNVFQDRTASRQCRIKYAIAGQEHSVDWPPNGHPVAAIRSIDIFDSDVASYYLSQETETAYTPPVVALFKELAVICDRVGARLDQERTELVSTLPVLPAEYRDTDAGKSYAALTHDMSDAAINGLVRWSDEDEKTLRRLTAQLETADPAALARQKRQTKAQLDRLAQHLRKAAAALGSESIQQLGDLRTRAGAKRKIAAEAAQLQNGAANLPGIGSDTWNAMWEAAREYSSVAYQGSSFPATTDGARCVLCQQTLDSDARQRLRDFEAFVQGAVEAEAKHAEESYKAALAALPPIPKEDDIRTQCEAAGLMDESFEVQIRAFWEEVSSACDCLRDGEKGRPALPVESPRELLEAIDERSLGVEKDASQSDTDAHGFNREAAIKRKLDLEARRWTAQQSASIRTEVARLKSVAWYDVLRRLANSRAISVQAGEVAERVVTQTYVDRFNNELKELGASRLRVELVKTRTAKGKPLHQIRLKGVSAGINAPEAVLSEGERRIVSLAAFLADVVAQPHAAPFVFDDPISSLDQDYEWRVAKRLAELAKNRQVLVFTHRLSLYGAMEDAARKLGEDWKKNNLFQLCIESFGANTGHPADGAAWNANTKKANNILLARLDAAKTVGETGGPEAYKAVAQTICSDFRKLVERTVEDDLLNQVVRRHRRSIQTDNRLGILSRITADDCKFIDDLMTKYSCYEHSQSSETPAFLPEEPELRLDLEALRDWREEFNRRAKGAR